MRRVRTTLLAAMMLAVLLVPFAASESAGNVQFSADNIIFSPSSPTEGDDVQVKITLSNQDVSEITGVEVTFHPDSISNPAFHTQTVNIPGSGNLQVTGVWQSITFGSHTAFVVVTHSGSTANVSKQFQVSGLANFVPSNLGISPSSDIRQGDVVQVSVTVANDGNLEAGTSHLLFQLDGQSLNEVTVPTLPAGQSTVVSTTFNAPAPGSHTLEVVANSQNDGIEESDVSDNTFGPLTFTVSSNPDYLHYGDPEAVVTVTSSPDALGGPWTLSGDILRMGGSGTSNLSNGIYLVQGETQILVREFTTEFTDSNPLNSWQEVLTENDLNLPGAGTYTLRIEIDTSRQVPQSIQFNDYIDTSIQLHSEPNVAVSPHAAASGDSFTSGESVSFNVTVTNTGILPVIGTLTATFDGDSLTPQQGLAIPAGEERTYSFQAVASGTEGRQLQFIANWVPNAGSYDADAGDNIAFGSITLHSDLKLRFMTETESWTPSDSTLVVGTEYTYIIEVIADEGSGSEEFTCQDYIKRVNLSTDELSFGSVGAKNSIICTFTPQEAGPFELWVIPDGSSVGTWVSAWSIQATSNQGLGESTSNADGTRTLLIFAALALLAVLIAGLVLSRIRDDDTERETFEYCPSCDGEIEGDEATCPHCDFDLATGLSQFHDCAECSSSIPDMMEHCPYCGAPQDISTFYEKRERRERVVEDIDEETDEEDDQDEIVRGSEGYDDAISEFGYDADRLESEWDERLETAESEIDEAQAERERQEELTEEEEQEEFAPSQLRESFEEHRADLDEIIGDKKKRRHLKDEEVEFSASDADIRKDIYELTGEEGILPGEQVNVEFIPDNTVVGNELKESSQVTDFTVVDTDDPVAKITESEEEPDSDVDSGAEEEKAGRKRPRRAPRRRNKESDE